MTLTGEAMPSNNSSGMSRRQVLGAGAGVGVGVALGALFPGVAKGEAGAGVGTEPIRVVELRTEFARNPLGIDAVKPRLSWWLAGGGRGVRQSAYQILVASSPDRLTDKRADLWNSGRVSSSESVDIEYAGRPLAARSLCHWTVRVWDADGEPSGWGAPNQWEMGLLDPADWLGTWIGAAAGRSELTLDKAHWIWFPEGDPAAGLPPMERYFRRSFDVPADRRVKRARILLTADDRFVLWANGVKQAETTADGQWRDGRVVDLTAALATGGNVLAIAATNTSASPAGLIARLAVEYETGPPSILDSGGEFRASDRVPDGWQDPAFDDGSWVRAQEVVLYGGGPWGRGVSETEVVTPAPLLCREFMVRENVRRARLYVAGVGYHELELNGRKVGDHVLDPAPTDYDERVLSVTHDVTAMLHKGQNAVGAELGRGFFGERVSTAWDWTTATWHGEPRLLAQLEIEYADGTRDTVVTDPQWCYAEGPTQSDSIYAGETYDARLARPGWSTPGHDRRDWPAAAELAAPAGRVVAQRGHPIQVVETVAPVAITEPLPGTYVFDLGRTLGGWAELRVQGPPGTRLALQYSQQLHADGTADADQTYVQGGRFQCDEYVLSGSGTEIWRPRFSHKSFRYVQVTGLPAEPGKDFLRGHEVRTAAPVTSGFFCSNELYNRIHGLVVRSTGHHLLGIPAVDVMYEKIGWTADGHLNLPSVALNFRARAFLVKWLDDLGDSQRPDGLMPVIAPSGGWGYDWRAPEWTAAYPIVMWELYQRFGDRRTLDAHYGRVRRYVDWSMAQLDGDGLAVSSLGDWLAPGGTQPPEDRRLSATAYLCRTVQIVVDAASVLGFDTDVRSYSELLNVVRDRFNAAFLDRERGNYRTATDDGYRQTSNLLPLAFGLVPAGLVEQVVAGLVADVRARGHHLDTGALGTALLLPLLTRHGHVDVAHAVASQRTYPSWGYWLDNGADTLWETWELHNEGQGRPPSHDHYLFGSIDRWFFEHLAGITAAEPGYRHVRIRPSVTGLAHATARIETVRGMVGVEWRHDGGSLVLRVEVPANTTADVHVPGAGAGVALEGARPGGGPPGVTPLGDGVFRVGSGNHQFTARVS